MKNACQMRKLLLLAHDFLCFLAYIIKIQVDHASPTQERGKNVVTLDKHAWFLFQSAKGAPARAD